MLGVSVSTISRWIADGRLVSRRIAYRHQVSLASVESMLAAASTNTPAEGGAK